MYTIAVFVFVLLAACAAAQTADWSASGRQLAGKSAHPPVPRIKAANAHKYRMAQCALPVPRDPCPRSVGRDARACIGWVTPAVSGVTWHRHGALSHAIAQQDAHCFLELILEMRDVLLLGDHRPCENAEPHGCCENRTGSLAQAAIAAVRLQEHHLSTDASRDVNMAARCAVQRQPYIEWVRQEVRPLHYTVKKGVFRHNWPGTPGKGGANATAASDAQGGRGLDSRQGGSDSSGSSGTSSGSGSSGSGGAAPVGPGDVVLMAQTSPDRCAASEPSSFIAAALSRAHSGVAFQAEQRIRGHSIVAAAT
jgi:uncharacterized membrane protein YgcG